MTVTPNTTITKFALHTFKGTPTRYFRVEATDMTSQAVKEVRKPTHHILVVDRSGSMYGDIPDLRTTVEKLLTLSEFRDPSLRVSLVSYSSKGDVTLHFNRVPITDVMATDSKHLKAIRSIQATAMTCISQGLVMAETLVDDGDTTCITLHTDGFANDLSPSQEQRDIAAAVAKLKNHPAMFCNTIGYRSYCDYNLLASIANGLSGKCIQAKGVREVYEAIYSSTKLLSGAMAPELEIPGGGATYTMFVSRSAQKALGSKDMLLVRGLSPSDDKTAYRLYEVSAKDYAALNVPVNGDAGTSLDPIFAFARTQIAEGNLNAAKFAVMASRCQSLYPHVRALVSSDIAALADAVESHLFNANAAKFSTQYGLPAGGPSVLAVLAFLNANSHALAVNLPDLAKGYKRRGIKRIPGTRNPDGSVTEPDFYSKVREGGDGWVDVNGFELNRNTATVNMLLSQPIDVFPKGGSSRVASVAGVNLDRLRSYNNYTLVGDGQLNVSSLLLRTSDQKVLDGLRAMGLNPSLPGQRADAKAGDPFVLDLSDLPLVDYDLNVGAVSFDTARTLARLTVLSKILNGMVKGDASGFTSEQVTELKKHYLTPAMYFSPPTTTEYADLKDAIAKGEVDTKLSYKVNIGTPDLTEVGKLKSGNEYLQRRFTATMLGQEVEKPTLDLMTTAGVTWGIKKLSARTTLDAVDTLSYPIYEGILGLGDGKEVKAILKSIGCVDPDLFLKDLRGPDSKTVVKDAIRFVDDAIEDIYAKIRPLVFYIGAAGMVPDTLGAKMMSADDFAKLHSEAKLSKAEKEEGTFFVLPDQTVLTVYVKAEPFSTGSAAAA